MRKIDPRLFVLAGLAALMTALPAAAAPDGSAAQTVAVDDSRTGTGPCGFTVQRDLHGTVEISPSVDAAGNLVMAIDRVNLRGELTNLANGKTVDLWLMDQSVTVGLAGNGSPSSIELPLTGRYLRKYDDPGNGLLTMDMPADGASLLPFVAGKPASDPWTHVCGLLA